MTDKKLKIILYVCVTFFLVTLIYFFVGSKNEVVPVETATSTPVIATSIPVVRMESFTYATSSISLTVEYAQFSRLSSSTIEKGINATLKKEAKNIYDEQLKELRQSVTPESLPGQSGKEVFFERKLQKEKIYSNFDTGVISIPYANYIDTGGAHGMFFYTSQTLDSNTGKKLVLKDMLQGEYEEKVITEVKRQIAFGTSTESCVNCFQELSEQEDVPVFMSDAFLLTEKGIVFLYSAYDLGAYALTSAGQEILVSKEVIESFVGRVW